MNPHLRTMQIISYQSPLLNQETCGHVRPHSFTHLRAPAKTGAGKNMKNVEKSRNRRWKLELMSLQLLLLQK